MRLHPKILFLVLAVVVGLTVIVGYPGLFSELTAQQRVSPVARQNKMIPIPLAAEEADLQKRLERQEKNRRFYNPRGDDLMAQGEGEIFGRTSYAEPSSAIPVTESDFIILGRVLKAQPYFAEANTSIYSEFEVAIEEIIAESTNRGTRRNGPVMVTREGGAIKMPDERIIQFTVSGIGALPERDKRYLFFLKPACSQCLDFSIVVGYELDRNTLIPIDRIKDSATYEGMSESDFVSAVKKAVKSN